MKSMSTFAALFLTLSTVLGSAAYASDINLGSKDGEDEYAMLSIRDEGAMVRIRVRIYENEARCTQYRKDLCHLEDKVSLLEVTAPASACHIQNLLLLSCNLDGFTDPPTQVVVILEDGTRKEIGSAAGYVRVNHVTIVDYKGDLVEQNLLDTEVWGNRADGLDPIIQSEKGGLFGAPDTLQQITKSLF